MHRLPPERVAIERALGLLETAGAGFFKENGCISCHNQSIPEMASGRAYRVGIAVNVSQSNTHTQAMLTAWQREVDRMWETSCVMAAAAYPR
jgi:hypothetical protein